MSKVTEIHKSLVPETERSHILQDHMREIQKTLKEVEKGCSLTTEQNFFLAIEDRTEESSKAMSINAGETTFWVVQTFMNKFNAAAEELKDK